MFSDRGSHLRRRTLATHFLAGFARQVDHLSAKSSLLAAHSAVREPPPDLHRSLAEAHRQEKRRSLRRGWLLSGAVALTLAFASCSAAPRSSEPPSAEPQPASGRVSVKSLWLDPQIRAAALAGGHPAPPDMSMRVHVYVTPMNPEEFNRVLAATEDPHSPMYGHHLTPQELKRFERPLSDYEAIERWLGSYGIKVLSADRAAFVRTILTEGTASQFEAALNVRIDQSANGQRYSNMSDPQIPANLGGVIGGFGGLDNLGGYAKCCAAHSD
jgi:hypothetical protein